MGMYVLLLEERGDFFLVPDSLAKQTISLSGFTPPSPPFLLPQCHMGLPPLLFLQVNDSDDGHKEKTLLPMENVTHQPT